jgi:AbrB family looped-hinge helix DNA binding protein
MREFVSTITSRGQVTVPVEIRRRLRLDTPDKISFVLDDEGNVALRKAKLSVADLRGIVPPLPGRTSDDFEEQIEEAMEDEAARIVASLREE